MCIWGPRKSDYCYFGHLGPIKANVPSFPHDKGVAISVPVDPIDKVRKWSSHKINSRPGAKKVNTEDHFKVYCPKPKGPREIGLFLISLVAHDHWVFGQSLGFGQNSPLTSCWLVCAVSLAKAHNFHVHHIYYNVYIARLRHFSVKIYAASWYHILFQHLLRNGIHWNITCIFRQKQAKCVCLGKCSMLFSFTIHGIGLSLPS